MYTPAERKIMLRDMRNDIMERLKTAQADLDAVDRLITVQKEIEPPTVTASVGEIRQAAISLLREIDGPVHRQTLLSQMNERGVHVSGRTPVNNLGSILSRFSKDFESHGQGVWGLKAPLSSNGIASELGSTKA